MNPNLPSSPIVSGALPLPAADPVTTPATVVPNLAPPGAGLNPPPVFNQPPMPQLPPVPPAAIPQAPLNPSLSSPVPPQVINPQVLPTAPVQMATPPQVINPQVLPTAPVQMATPPQVYQSSGFANSTSSDGNSASSSFDAAAISRSLAQCYGQYGRCSNDGRYADSSAGSGKCRSGTRRDVGS